VDADNKGKVQSRARTTGGIGLGFNLSCRRRITPPPATASQTRKCTYTHSKFNTELSVLKIDVKIPKIWRLLLFGGVHSYCLIDCLIGWLVNLVSELTEPKKKFKKIISKQASGN